MCNALYNIYSTELKKKRKTERNEKHVFVSDEELEEEAREKRQRSWQRRCMKLQIFRIPMDRYAPSTYEKSLRTKDLSSKYEIRARVNIGVDVGLFDVNAVTARSRYRKVFAGERRIEFHSNAKRNIL